MNRKFFFAFCVVCLTVLLSQTLPAEEIEDINLARSRFFIDHATFADSGANRIEIYYKIFNDGLSYVKKGDKYVANYEVNVIILGHKSKQVTGKSIEKTYVLDDYQQTHSESGFLLNQVSLPLAQGNYDLVCKLSDHNSNEVSTIESKVNSFNFDRGGDISDIEFIQEVGDLAEQLQFVKGGSVALPSVERSFDSEQQKLGFYVEVYAGNFVGQGLELKYQVRSPHGASKLEGSFPVRIDSTLTPAKDFVGLSDLEPAEYDFHLMLMQGDKTIAERSSRFMIKWSMASLIKNDFEYAVEQLKYLMSKEDRKKLLQTPDSLREEAFENWWKGKDPTPKTPGNELRDEYYRRIRYANQYYSAVGKEGWETDRGNIYIRFGEPDQIDRHPYEQDSKPYQIWYYYAQKRTFVFEDTHGDGDFQLKPPYDGDWRKGL